LAEKLEIARQDALDSSDIEETIMKITYSVRHQMQQVKEEKHMLETELTKVMSEKGEITDKYQAFYDNFLEVEQVSVEKNLEFAKLKESVDALLAQNLLLEDRLREVGKDRNTNRPSLSRLNSNCEKRSLLSPTLGLVRSTSHGEFGNSIQSNLRGQRSASFNRRISITGIFRPAPPAG